MRWKLALTFLNHLMLLLAVQSLFEGSRTWYIGSLVQFLAETVNLIFIHLNEN